MFGLEEFGLLVVVGELSMLAREIVAEIIANSIAAGQGVEHALHQTMGGITTSHRGERLAERLEAGGLQAGSCLCMNNLHHPRCVIGGATHVAAIGNGVGDNFGNYLPR